MKRHNKENAPLTDQDDVVTDEVFQELAEVLAEETGKHASLENEPFESYIHKVHAKMFKDLHLFRTRLSQGYRLLLDEVKSGQAKH
jgi:hypothetical protein